MMKILSTLLLTTGLSIANASECDCQKIVGSCMGAIEFLKSYGSTPSFGAEFVVHSSERQCSKVEYFIDTNPYQTVLINKNHETESTFGTKPIKKENIIYKSCSVCASIKNVSANKSPDDSKSRKAPTSFSGDWVMAVSCDWLLPFQRAERYRFTLSEADNGEYIANGSIGNGVIQSSTIRNGSVKIITQHSGNMALYSGRTSDADSMSGEMTQDANSSVCKWEARKQ